ncbi:hypothetical protein LTS18_003676 [Coniosporium uncinatum]|uniref:Uncharacterized protein n=1 Tax=Coniosporium uncinatum TaxID=93489 RepID=A0ACC3DBV2_9PEZI|nr:hypothetical protein LTS18_003676 [Coniosporium uncinatum]
MSTAVWPPIAPDQLERELELSRQREVQWLLTSLQDTLKSLKEGLEECAALLAPSDENASTLVLSTHRSEALKGFVTRIGTRVVKGSITLRLPSLPQPKDRPHNLFTISQAPQAPSLVLAQITTARNAIASCLDVVDVSTYTGDPANANFISGQLQLLDENLQEARNALKGDPGPLAAPTTTAGGSSNNINMPWFDNSAEEASFEPPLPGTLAVTTSIADAALRLEVRTLERVHSSSHHKISFRDQLAVALGGARTPTHDEANETFVFRGQEVKVKEKVRVESQDPALMAAMAKLGALERTLGLGRRALGVVMGMEGED